MIFFCIIVKILKMVKTIAIDETLYDEISEYCKLNKLTIKDFSEKALKEALMLEKYGDAPFFNKPFVKINPDYIVGVDAASGDVKTVITTIDTKENKIVKVEEIKPEPKIEESKPEVEHIKVEQKPATAPKPRVRRLK